MNPSLIAKWHLPLPPEGGNAGPAAGQNKEERVSTDGIKGGSAAEGTAKHIEDLIVEGALRPGEPLLGEREMASRLNVSRPTLRQGMKILEDKGLLVAEPGGARVVAPLATSITDPLIALLATRSDVVDDYIELRANLESMAARLAATRANEVDRGVLREAMERIDDAHGEADPRTEAEADVDLHVAIYEASHNLVLLHIMRALSGMLRKGIFLNREKLYARPEVREVLREQHRAIFETILARDPDAAGRAAETHMNYTQRVIAEIAAADARLEISLRRLEGGSIARGGRSRE